MAVPRTHWSSGSEILSDLSFSDDLAYQSKATAISGDLGPPPVESDGINRRLLQRQT
jgi:hypothetical protein